MKISCFDPISNEDQIKDILSRLPVKTLMRFTCVSKSWESFIMGGGDPSFVKLHLKRSPKNMHILLSLEEEDTPDFAIGDTYVVPYSVRSLLKKPSSIINDELCYHLKAKYLIVGSCNGLVCLGSFYVDDLIDEFWVRLWNPATHLRSKKSPTVHINWGSGVNASGRKVNVGFGYDESRDTYKVVVVLWDCAERKMKIKIHCIGDNYWREMLCDPCFPFLLAPIDGKFVGGCVNWLALKNLDGHNYQWNNITLQQLVIVSFDMGKEIFKYLSIPDGISEVPKDEPRLEVLGNYMCLSHDQNSTHFVLWQMRKYEAQESWTRVVNVSYKHLRYEGFLYDLSMLWLSKDGDILLIANRKDMKVIKYNVRGNYVEYIKNPDGEILLSSDEYVPSLVSPCQY